MNSKNIWIILILTLALFLRIYKLDEVPIELFGDEIDVGLQANSILKTGKDYHGNFYPVMFHSLDEYRLPLFIYSAVPTIGLFGLNEWGVRLAGVFWGMLGILGIYLLTKKLFDKNLALIATAFLTISPWHLQYSRQAGIESIALLALIILAVWCYLNAQERYKYFIISAVLFGLSVYTYAAGIVFILFFSLFLLIRYFSDLKKYKIKKLFLVGLVGFLVLLPYLNLYTSGKSSQRFGSLAVWSDQSLVDTIINRRNNEGNLAVSNLFHNKGLTYFYEISGNFLKSVSADFLFFSGDPNLRHSVGGMGLLYLFDGVLIIFGIKKLFSLSVSKNSRILVLVWLVLAPIASALTRDGGYHASRLILMLPPLVILSALGLNFLIENFKRLWSKNILIVVVILMLINTTSYLHRYYIDWPLDSFRFWHYGFEESMKYVKSIDQNYSRIYFNNSYEPSLSRFLFWYQYDPSVFQAEFKSSIVQSNLLPGFDGFKLNNKYYFGNLNAQDRYKTLSDLLADNGLYVLNAQNEIWLDHKSSDKSEPFKILKVIYNPYTMEPERIPLFFIVVKNQ